MWLRIAFVAILAAGALGPRRARAGPAPPEVVIPLEAQGRPLVEIQVLVDGARRTVPEAVRRLMSTRVGDPLDAARLTRDLARLRETQMIAEADAYIETTPAGPRLLLSVRDKWSAFFYAGVRRGGARTITRVGLADNNALGRLFQVTGEINSGADIPFVARSSGDRVGSALHLTMPRLRGTMLTPSASWVREFFDFAAWNWDDTPGLVYDRARRLQRAALRWDVADDLALTLKGVTFSDGYRLNSRSPPGPLPPSGRTTSLGLELQLGHVDQYLSRFEGWQLTFGAEGAAPGVLGSDFGYAMGSVAGKVFLVPHPGHNLALQLVLAGTTAQTDSHLLRAGGLYELRGFRDSTFVARRILRGNVEYRVEALETFRPLHAIIQVVGFVDAGYIGDRGRALSGLAYEGPVVSAGAGLRINLVPIARAIGRVDFAFGLHPLRRFEIAFGVQQFF
jgi:hypothetical protein